MTLIKKILKRIFLQPSKVYVPLEKYFKKIDQEKYKFFYDSSYYVKRLEQAGGIFFVEGDDLYVELSGLKLVLRTQEELFILDEVFVDKLYQFNANKKVVVIDIGTNVGFSALYFSQLPNVEKIYTYEPFPDTLNQAMHNFKNNPKEFSKINTHLFALGASNKQQEVNYNYEHKGNMSIDKCIQEHDETSDVKTKIEIRRASEIFEEILKTHPSSFIAVKSDCEGSEYPIFTDLYESKLLKRIDYCVLETHHGRHAEIEKQLLDDNFQVKILVEDGSEVGLIYASKN